jgi:ribosome-binding protein aMBF1 (putative translation factor)
MIRTDAEYRNALERLDEEAETLDRQRAHLRQEMDLSDDEMERAMQPMISFRKQLEEEVEVYERMKRGDLGELQSLRAIGRWLIGARIARGLTQKELAERLDVSPSQVSRDERNDYHGITVDRAQRIMDALGVRFEAGAENVLDRQREHEHA